MKFLIITIAFLAAACADVSHLNNEYLPPDHHHHEHAPSQQIDTIEHHEQPHQAEAEHETVHAEPTPAEEQYESTNVFAIDVRGINGMEEVDAIQVFEAPEETHHQEAASAPVPDHLAELFHSASAQSSDSEQAEAAQFVPQTYGPSIEYSNVGAEGVFGAESGNSIEYGYDAAAASAASSAIDTQYGSNGGYIY